MVEKCKKKKKRILNSPSFITHLMPKYPALPLTREVHPCCFILLLQQATLKLAEKLYLLGSLSLV